MNKKEVSKVFLALLVAVAVIMILVFWNFLKPASESSMIHGEATSLSEDGADLSGELRIENMIVGETSNITAFIYNQGDEKTEDGKAKVYYQKGYCFEEECANLTLINSKEIGLESEKFREEIFEFIPEEAGYHTFVFILNASNEVNPEDNIDYLEVIVKERGPDIEIRDWWQESRLIKGQESNILFVVENIGTEIARDINVSLYLVTYAEFEGPERPPAEYELIRSELINELDSKAKIEVDIPIILEEKGDIVLLANASIEIDVYLSNNEGYFQEFVYNDGLDVAIDWVSYDLLIVNKTTIIRVILRNVGNQVAENTNVSLYFDNEFIGNKTTEKIEEYYDVDFEITPKTIGEKTLKAVADLNGDLDLEDNIEEDEIRVYRIKKVNLTLTDSEEKNITRELFTKYAEYFTSNSNLIIEVLEGRELFGIIKFFGENVEVGIGPGGVGILFEGEEMSENEKVISEYYEKIEQEAINYYSVFANEVGFDYGEVEFAERMENEYAQEIGLDIADIGEYSLFYCEDFDFLLKKCSGSWEEIEDVDFWEFGGGFEFGGKMEDKKIEAFGLSEAPDFSGNTTDLENITGDFAYLVFENIHGRISFKGKVNISRIKADKNLTKKNIKIRKRKMKVDTNALPELENVFSQLLFKNINFKNPKVLYDGETCPGPICTSFYYNKTGNYIVMNVTGFSEFKIIGGPYCGDGSCQSDAGESCSTCTADCGICGVGGGPGGDGGSGGGCIPNWNCTWGPCKDKIQNLVCVDLNKCPEFFTRLEQFKKPEDTRVCFIEGDCIDNDGDGYGEGVDCLGPDLNDNDPGITISLIEELRINITKYLIYALIMIAIISAIVFLLTKHRKK